MATQPLEPGFRTGSPSMGSTATPWRDGTPISHTHTNRLQRFTSGDEGGIAVESSGGGPGSFDGGVGVGVGAVPDSRALPAVASWNASNPARSERDRPSPAPHRTRRFSQTEKRQVRTGDRCGESGGGVQTVDVGKPVGADDVGERDCQPRRHRCIRLLVRCLGSGRSWRPSVPRASPERERDHHSEWRRHRM